MAHKRGLGSAKNGRDSNSQRLGVKRYGGQVVTAGSVLIRQRGTVFKPGFNVARARDDTLYALTPGVVRFESLGTSRQRISVYPPHPCFARPLPTEERG